MSAPKPLEQVLLSPVTRQLQRAIDGIGKDPAASRLEVLEAIASRLGGWHLDDYRDRFPEVRTLTTDEALAVAADLSPQLATAGVIAPLALCSMARPELNAHAQRTDGVYYTDFRLAVYLAGSVAQHLTPDSLLVDAASGTGILLVATVIAVCGDDRAARARLLRHGVCAADLSVSALRGARLALASLTEDLDAVAALGHRMRVQDSLIQGREGWRDVAPGGFDAVVGNPPWEKVKITRHEFLRARGDDRHYGDDYALGAVPNAAIADQRRKAAAYAMTLAEKYPLSGTGEADLYKAFLELSTQLAAPAGRVAMLVPAGLIRSQGTQQLREALLSKAATLDITVSENRARFFAIDTRFKFLVVEAGLAGTRRAPIVLRHARGTDDGVERYGHAVIGRAQLADARSDLSVPEVRSSDEWRLFRRMASGGERLGDDNGRWQPRIVREVDMTRDRKRFRRTGVDGMLPLIEGRMVHQFRVGAKAYVSGTGRRAIWEPLPVGMSTLEPQFWIAKDNLPRSARGRHEVPRVGFCDITGQTNERSILAARIPPNAICGNKVPTLTLGGQAGQSPHALDLWLAIANSFAFDWLARRVVTTTVNFFLLLGLPFPALDPDSLPARRLGALAHEVTSLGTTQSVDPWDIAAKRAAIDARVAFAYGLTLEDLELILADFPLLDRAQPPIHSEARSTVTRDLVLATFGELIERPASNYARRAELARSAGATAYIPAQYTDLEGDEEAIGASRVHP